MKDFFKSPLVITILVIAGIGLLYFGGSSLFKAGQKNALTQELNAVNSQIASVSARMNPDAHIKLLAKRNAIQNLLSQL